MPRKPTPVVDRLFARIEVDDETGCWNWIGSRDARGYGHINTGTKSENRIRGTHRVCYEVNEGPVPDGLVLDHLCRNPSCCNPEHLEPVTQKVNMHRGEGSWSADAAKTHCKWGHEFTPDNTQAAPRGRRCITCSRRRARESKARAKANA